VSIETDAEDLYQVALLIDQLKHEDVALRIHAFKSIDVIGMTCSRTAEFCLLLMVYYFIVQRRRWEQSVLEKSSFPL
jgi:hypothetical protein